MNGLVRIEVSKDQCDSVLLGLSCKEEVTQRRGIFFDLSTLIYQNLLREPDKFLPDDVREALSLEIKVVPTRDEIWGKCDTINDAILEASEHLKDEICLEQYSPLQVLVGRNYVKVFVYRHPGMKLASAIMAGGPGLNSEDPSTRVTAETVAREVAKQVALTNPLCIHSYVLSGPMFDYIRLRSYDEAIAQRLEEAANEIATTNIVKFFKETVVSEQEYRDTTMDKLMEKASIYCLPKFIRYHIK